MSILFSVGSCALNTLQVSGNYVTKQMHNTVGDITLKISGIFMVHGY